MTDEFKGDTGLKDDYNGTITTAEFTQGQRGNWNLHLVITAEDGDEVEQNYSVGGADKGWTSYDGGETIEGPSQKARFHDRSTVQQFIYAAMAAGAEDELRNRSQTLYGSRGPFHAALWQGLSFHWDVVKEKQNRPDEQQQWHEVEVDVMRPTKFLGTSGGRSPRTPANQTTAQGGTGSNAPTQAPSSNGSDADTDTIILKGLARTATDHGHFADLVMEAADSAGEPFLKNKPVMKQLAQKEWFEALRS